MTPAVEYETVRESNAGEGGRREVHEHHVERRPVVGRVAYPGPPSTWYENLPVWVAISIFLHGLALLILIVLLASPGTFGLASEGDVDRLRLQGGATPASIDARVSALERQASALTAGAAAQSGTPQQLPSTGATVDLTPRLSALETRVAGLCAAATPPC